MRLTSMPLPISELTAARLASAVAVLANDTTDRYLSAQLHALAAVLTSWSARSSAGDVRAELEAALADALTAHDEMRVVAAARALARLDRSCALKVDWTAVSRG
jgi:hypothetical protein